MIAFKVSVNGKHLCNAGADDLGVLNSIINAVGQLGDKSERLRVDESADLFLSVGGLTSRCNLEDEHMTWIEHHELKLGDKVEIELVEVSGTDEPVSRFTHKPKS